MYIYLYVYTYIYISIYTYLSIQYNTRSYHEPYHINVTISSNYICGGYD